MARSSCVVRVKGQWLRAPRAPLIIGGLAHVRDDPGTWQCRAEFGMREVMRASAMTWDGRRGPCDVRRVPPRRPSADAHRGLLRGRMPEAQVLRVAISVTGHKHLRAPLTRARSRSRPIQPMRTKVSFHQDRLFGQRSARPRVPHQSASGRTAGAKSRAASIRKVCA